MSRKIVLLLSALLSFFVIISLIFYFLNTRGIELKDGKKLVFNGLIPNVETIAFYSIDESASLKLLHDVGFQQPNLKVIRLSNPSDKIGVQYKDEQGRVLLSSFLETGNRDTIVWSMYISPDFEKLKLSGLTDVDSKLAKEQSATNIALMSFISSSQNPNRDAFTLFPPETRPVLITLP